MVTPDTLAARFPKLYHMAALGSWACIRAHGLLSTSGLLDLFDVQGTQREQLEERHRPECVTIQHPDYGTAVVRDQKPMSDSGLLRALKGLTPRDWYRILNDKVFFWVTRARLETLMSARAYGAQRHTVLTVASAPLIFDYRDQIVLSPINSGCTVPFPHPRSAETFLGLGEYPFDEWDKKRGRKDPVVELAVRGGVPNIADYVLSVTEEGAGKPIQVVWTR